MIGNEFITNHSFESDQALVGKKQSFINSPFEDVVVETVMRLEEAFILFSAQLISDPLLQYC